MQAHALDLRSEVADDWPRLVDARAETAPSDADCDALVHQIVDDWRKAPLRLPVAKLLAFAERVTRTPASCAEANVADLRRAGWADAAIHDTVQVVAYFNYINRVADALGVEMERDLPLWGRSSMSEGADAGR